MSITTTSHTTTATYGDISITQSFYGRDGQLERLYREMHDYSLPYRRRSAASRIFHTIIRQSSDKTLMSMRVRLIKAAQAGDREAMAKITAQMKYYLGEDPESGGEDV